MLEILKHLLGIIGMVGTTTITMDANRGVEITGGAGVSGGLTVQGIELVDSSNSKRQWFEFVGAGIGVGLGPIVGGSFSDESFATLSGPVLKGPGGWGKINFDDLTGLGHVFSISAAAIESKGKGVGLSLVTMGEVGGEPLLCSGFVVFAGTMIAVPGAGAMVYKGTWRKVDK